MAKVAIVTGAAQGLAADGVDLAVNDLPEKQQALNQLVKEVTLLGRKAIVAVADVSSENEVQAMIEATVSRLGGLDIMIANAGVVIGTAPVLEVSDEVFDKTMAVNCKGTLYCYRAAAVQMIKQGKGGRIIGASSLVGLKGTPGNIPYVISKFAVRAITQTAALEWGQYNITVNAYAPGIVESPMMAGTANEEELEKVRQQVINNACLKRLGQPEDVASLCNA
ncbi:hypothetical protein FRC07_007762 [Ceratobasidium sp. 392]|nr:hypothetical protein FRC07_007762 [Ceratobasidium sp. 392]